MSKATERDKKITELLDSLFAQAVKKGTSLTSTALPKKDLDLLFSTTTWGFREIVLVIALARLIDENYRASVSFYECNPRPFYEGPIRAALAKRKIPHRKSGPLNIAKGWKSIDAQWAARRTPTDVAKLVVALVQRIESITHEELVTFTSILLSGFLEEANRIESLMIEVEARQHPLDIYLVCERLIDEVPDAGNTPQRIVGYLLEAYHQDLQTGIVVAGHEDRASVTNTTSKKPGDITEVLADGTVVTIYEVTVKKFDDARIQDSFEAIKAIDSIKNTEVSVICRPADVPESAKEGEALSEYAGELYLGDLLVGDIVYRFLDMYEWIVSRLTAMTPDARLSFYEKLGEYIADPNTAEKVKNCWKDLNED